MLSRILDLYDKVRLYVEIALLTGLITFCVLWRITSSDLSTEKEGRRQDKQSYEQAQAVATAIAVQNKIKQEAEDNARYEKASTDYGNLKSQYDALLLRYASTKGKAGGTGVSSSSQTSESSNGSSTDSVVPDSVVIPYKDAQVCADTVARLQVIHDWAVAQ